MKEVMYNKLVEIIRQHRTWIAVLEYKRDRTLMARSGTDLKPVRRRVLSLVATKPRGLYEKGHVWDITEDRLDRAVRYMRRDPKFIERWKHEVLLVEDVETLVSHAANNLLCLHLSETPQQNNPKK